MLNLGSFVSQLLLKLLPVLKIIFIFVGFVHAKSILFVVIL